MPHFSLLCFQLLAFPQRRFSFLHVVRKGFGSGGYRIPRHRFLQQPQIWYWYRYLPGRMTLTLVWLRYHPLKKDRKKEKAGKGKKKKKKKTFSCFNVAYAFSNSNENTQEGSLELHPRKKISLHPFLLSSLVLSSFSSYSAGTKTNKPSLSSFFVFSAHCLLFYSLEITSPLF